MEDGQLLNCDSDSSGGLPELFSNYTFDIAKLTKNDIVWALYNGFHWPALVRGVDKKKKKVKVWYLDSPGKCFKLDFYKIHDFVDSDFSKKIEDEAKNQPFGKKHAEVVRRTNLFTFRRFQGNEDDPVKFFDLSKPYFLPKVGNNVFTDNNINNVDISSENGGGKNVNFKDILEDESSKESDVRSFTSSKYVSELYEEDSPYSEEMVDKILSCITSGQVDKYLIDIVNSKITSERHTLYVEALKTGQVQLFIECQPSVPIQNQKLHDVSIYLHNLYNQKIGKDKPKLNEYIISVWLPEAVDKAISLIEEESIKPSYDLTGNKSCSPILIESSELAFDCCNKASSSTKVEVSELHVDSGSNKLSSVYQVEPSKLPIDSSSSNNLSIPKRRYNLRTSLVKNYISSELEIKICSKRKKKFTGSKYPKKSSERKKKFTGSKNPKKSSERKKKFTGSKNLKKSSKLGKNLLMDKPEKKMNHSESEI